MATIRKISATHARCVRHRAHHVHSVNATDLECTGTLFLPNSQLTFTMPYSFKTHSGEGALTGGTNAYQTVGDTFKVVARPEIEPPVSDYTLRIIAL